MGQTKLFPKLLAISIVATIQFATCDASAHFIETIEGHGDLIETEAEFILNPIDTRKATPSAIEFYYWDDLNEETGTKRTMETKERRNTTVNFKSIKNHSSSSIPRPSVKQFYLSNPSQRNIISFAAVDSTSVTIKEALESSTHYLLENNSAFTFLHKYNYPRTTEKRFYFHDNSRNNVTVTGYFKNTTLFDKARVKINKKPRNRFLRTIQLTKAFEQSENTESSTPYDKIKFFEIYDGETSGPYLRKNLRKSNKTKNILIDENKDNDYDKEIIFGEMYKKISSGEEKRNVNFLEQPSTYNHTVPDAKSSVKENIFRDFVSPTTPSVKKTHVIEGAIPSNDSDIFGKHSKPPILQNTMTELREKVSSTHMWRKYPFAAVYINERYQAHCDAAVFSPHWLLSAASCLSTRNEDLTVNEGRSPFVAYCGDSWWTPERINYVKRSLVHPRYHPSDTNRRHLYNIGVIQVVTSMSSACSNWEPVPILSYHFKAVPEGSMASAVGWGLDRYHSRNADSLPKRPLAEYQNLVYSETCPGSERYSYAKAVNEEGVKNVYCLTLPRYTGEEHHPVHGSLLLVGGKLAGLYLQEERRQSGEQSAQYTGVWGLIPWINEIAKEVEETEYFI